MFYLHFTGMCFPLVFLMEWWRCCLQSFAKYQALKCVPVELSQMWPGMDGTTLPASLLCTNWLRSIWTILVNHNNFVMSSVAAGCTPHPHPGHTGRTRTGSGATPANLLSLSCCLLLEHFHWHFCFNAVGHRCSRQQIAYHSTVFLNWNG